jgi:hypothetical protein
MMYSLVSRWPRLRKNIHFILHIVSMIQGDLLSSLKHECWVSKDCKEKWLLWKDLALTASRKHTWISLNKAKALREEGNLECRKWQFCTHSISHNS